MTALRNKIIKTTAGNIITPTFLPDATYGSIGGLSFVDLESTGIKEIVTTTLHLEKKLGSDYVQKLGGLHKFFNYDRPILTDSGGFQVFSLIHRRKSKLNKITDEGASFVDPVTGQKDLLTPESSLTIQHKLGSDIRVVLDEPLGMNDTPEVVESSVRRTTAWAKRSKEQYLKLLEQEGLDYSDRDTALIEGGFPDEPSFHRPLLGAVVQGGGSLEMRKRSAEELIEIGFDSYNFGGFPIKEDGRLDLELSEYLVNLLPADKIRYAMGVGNPDDIIALAHMGWDMFDCVLPTRNARHGYLYVPKGEGDKDFENYSVMHIKSERYKYADEAVASITHPLLKNISKAYLRHLLRINEAAGKRLATLHNLFFYQHIINSLRTSAVL